MRTLALLLIVFVNVALLLLAAGAALTPGIPVAGRVTGGAVSLGLLAAIACLLLRRAGRLPPWGDLLMRVVCISVPSLWFLGSMDHTMVSGQEWAFILVAGAVMWTTWRIFKFVRP